MSFIQKIKGQVQQHASPAVVTTGLEPEPPIAPTSFKGDDTGNTSAMSIRNHAADAENQKPVIQAVTLGEEGAQRIELMQEVWGKHGKLYIFISYVPIYH
jgi:hypothetical protein